MTWHNDVKGWTDTFQRTSRDRSREYGRRRLQSFAVGVCGFGLAMILSKPAWAQVDPGNIAFEVLSSGSCGSEIHNKNADGSGFETDLTSTCGGDSDPSYSLDGGKIVFISTEFDPNGEIEVMNFDGSNRTRLTTNTFIETDPSFNTDRTKIVFGSTKDDTSGEIYIMNADGSNVVRLTTNPGFSDTYPRFSPDGTKIVFERDSNIYTMNVNGSNLVNLTPNTGGHALTPSYSYDGTKIVFSSFGSGIGIDQDIYVMNADGSNRTHLPGTPVLDIQPVFSPDGTKIAFLGNSGGAADSTGIYVVNADGRNPAQFTNVGRSHPTWAPRTTPSNVGLTPKSSSAGPGTFRNLIATYADPNGAASISVALLRVGGIENSGNSANTLLCQYNAANGLLYLRNDAGTGYTGGIAPGSNITLSNSQGSLNCAATTVTSSGSDLIINWNIATTSALSGTVQPVFLYVRDTSNQSAGYTQFGSCGTIGNQAPTNVSLTPSSTTSAAGSARNFTAVYSDPNGYKNLQFAFLRVGGSANGLYVYYDVQQNLLYLRDDANTTWLGGYAPSSANTISNSQGSLNCASTTVSGSGTNLSVNWNLTPSTSFAGIGSASRSLELSARDRGNLNAAFANFGSWTITSGP